MKWLNFKRTDGGEVLLRADDIDYIVINNENHKAKIYQKNGKDQIVNSIGIANRLLLTAEKTKLNSLYGVMASRPLPDYDPEVLRSEIQDLKLENDRLAKRDDKMRQTIRSIACKPDCEYCSLRGSECSGHDMQLLAEKTLKELEEL